MICFSSILALLLSVWRIKYWWIFNNPMATQILVNSASLRRGIWQISKYHDYQILIKLYWHSILPTLGIDNVTKKIKSKELANICINKYYHEPISLKTIFLWTISCKIKYWLICNYPMATLLLVNSWSLKRGIWW